MARVIAREQSERGNLSNARQIAAVVTLPRNDKSDGQI